jgi:phospholipid transport system substrate-binding protein
MRKIDGRWRIINIIADGVSDLALERAEYSSVIRRYGFNALLAKLKERIAGYARKGADATASS